MVLQTRADCIAVFNETLVLAQADQVSTSGTERLELLLATHFQDNDDGAHFRSMLCYGRPNVPVTTNDFNTFLVLPLSKFQLRLHTTPSFLPIQLQKLGYDSTRALRLEKMKHAEASVMFMLRYVKNQFFSNNEDVDYFLNKPIPERWLRCIIIGKVERSQLQNVDVPSLEDLELRITRSLEFSVQQKRLYPQAKFFTVESALAWQTTPSDTAEKIDYDALYLKACSDFPAYLQQLLSAKDEYLDELAGVDVGHAYPEVEWRFKKMYDQAPPRRVDGINLKLGRDNKEVGGTVVALHQYISPKFLAYYTVDHDASCAYMKDERSRHKKDRKIRVASLDHIDTKPIWLQFGDTDVYLYLSQKASAAEEKWLFIVNFVMNLLVDFANDRIKAQHGGKGHRLELMRKRDYRVAVGSASNPLQGNYGKHQDGKNGTVKPGDPNYSTYQLMVPTLCIQNYAHRNTKIEWSPVADPTFTAGTVWQECILFHIQLLNVNELFVHYVSSSVVAASFIPPCRACCIAYKFPLH
jgi:hypothetical protein